MNGEDGSDDVVDHGRSAAYREREWPSKCNESSPNARDIHLGLWKHNTLNLPTMTESMP